METNGINSVTTAQWRAAVDTNYFRSTSVYERYVQYTADLYNVLSSEWFNSIRILRKIPITEIAFYE